MTTIFFYFLLLNLGVYKPYPCFRKPFSRNEIDRENRREFISLLPPHHLRTRQLEVGGAASRVPEIRGEAAEKRRYSITRSCSQSTRHPESAPERKSAGTRRLPGRRRSNLASPDLLLSPTLFRKHRPRPHRTSRAEKKGGNVWAEVFGFFAAAWTVGAGVRDCLARTRDRGLGVLMGGCCGPSGGQCSYEFLGVATKVAYGHHHGLM